MNAKSFASAAVMGLWLLCAHAAAQETPTPGIQPPPIKKPSVGPPEVMPPPTQIAPTDIVDPSPSGLSDWILYRRPGYDSPGPNIPLYTEAYLRVGPSIPVGGNYLGRQLQVGWTIEGGVRGLLFRQNMASAFVADLHILNTYDSGIGQGDPRVLNIFQKDAAGNSKLTDVSVTVRGYNRTLVGLGLGKEWYLWQPANSPGNHWRIGVDGGGRYGSGSMYYPEIRHRTDTLGGVYTAAHTDFEIPYGRCYLSWGLRAEWAYTWGDILQRQSDVQEINVLATFSVRY